MRNYGTAGTGTLDEYKYGYDSQGDVLWKQNVTADNAGVELDESYTYDYLGQLTAAYRGEPETGGNGGEKMPAGTPASYTANLNGLGSIYNNPANQPESGSEYDNNGNLTSENWGQDTFTYDAWNRLVSAQSPQGTVSYEYDGLGRLVERQSGGTTDYYFYAGSQVIETRETTTGQPATNAPVQYQYVWSPGGGSPICRDTISGGQMVPGDRIYYLTDANDNVTALVGNSGGAWQVVERYVYTPFGGVTIYQCSGNSWTQAQQVSASPSGNTILFAAMSLDADDRALLRPRPLVRSGERGVHHARSDGLRGRRPEPLPLLRQQPHLRHRPHRAGPGVVHRGGRGRPGHVPPRQHAGHGGGCQMVGRRVLRP